MPGLEVKGQSAMRGPYPKKLSKTSFMRWIDEQLDRDPGLREKVDKNLNSMRLEQDLIASSEQHCDTREL